MSDLSRSLIDAAAEVLPAAYAESCGLPENMRDTAGEPQEWRVEARAAVVAVLETLASRIRLSVQGAVPHGTLAEATLLRAGADEWLARLAIEVKEGRG